MNHQPDRIRLDDYEKEILDAYETPVKFPPVNRKFKIVRAKIVPHSDMQWASSTTIRDTRICFRCCLTPHF